MLLLLFFWSSNRIIPCTRWPSVTLGIHQLSYNSWCSGKTLKAVFEDYVGEIFLRKVQGTDSQDKKKNFPSGFCPAPFVPNKSFQLIYKPWLNNVPTISQRRYYYYFYYYYLLINFFNDDIMQLLETTLDNSIPSDLPIFLPANNIPEQREKLAGLVSTGKSKEDARLPTP